MQVRIIEVIDNSHFGLWRMQVFLCFGSSYEDFTLGIMEVKR